MPSLFLLKQVRLVNTNYRRNILTVTLNTVNKLINVNIAPDDNISIHKLKFFENSSKSVCADL